MTRINSAIHVRRLTDEHLLAEHREIKRLPYAYKKRIETGKGFKDIPKEFTLGTGHVLFFTDKNKFTFERYKQIHEECLKRGFEPSNYEENWLICDDKHFNDYTPTIKEYGLLIHRITERLLGSKKQYWHYYGKQISKQEAIDILNRRN